MGQRREQKMKQMQSTHQHTAVEVQAALKVSTDQCHVVHTLEDDPRAWHMLEGCCGV